MFEMMVLANLMCQPCHGYELKTHLYRLNPNNNKIYPTLQNLSDKGYVVSEIQIQEGRPNRKIYSITPKGQEYFCELLRDFDFAKAQNSDEFNIRISFSFLLERETILYILDMREKALLHQTNVPRLHLTENTEDISSLRALHGQLRDLELAYIKKMKEKYSA